MPPTKHSIDQAQHQLPITYLADILCPPSADTKAARRLPAPTGRRGEGTSRVRDIYEVFDADRWLATRLSVSPEGAIASVRRYASLSRIVLSKSLRAVYVKPWRHL